ncbi:MAG: DUF1492 domain-containing protein [Oscillospiraceae bacterium]|nr:DUF1492 domain-containing protein [Oscillospiraceae bacterium]
MTAKEYLDQAYRLDQRIDSKLSQVSSLNDLALKCTSTITGMPRNPSPSVSSMEVAICKIVDLEDEINHDIDALVDLKREIVDVIKKVDNIECQTLLELRYLCFKTWEEIAVEMNYCIDNVYKLHRKALSKVKVPEEKTVQ